MFFYILDMFHVNEFKSNCELIKLTFLSYELGEVCSHF
jgi:hypothetical protein